VTTERAAPGLRHLAGLLVGIVVLALLVIAGLAWSAMSPRDGAPTVAARPSASAATPRSGLATIAVAQLPAEARETLALVDRGGPYPYEKDGTTFNNFEGRLPDRPRGYYREFTVPTPGERDRGARRLVVGTGGDVYYTDDHYASFRQVVR
jgi:ribonuclease T1